MSFGDIVRFENSPTSEPSGIGGDASTIWHCEDTTNQIYELDPSDFSTVRSSGAPSSEPYGVGGDDSTIWFCDFSYVREISTADLSSIRFVWLGDFGTGIGGDTNTIWHCLLAGFSRVEELSTTDLSQVRSESAPSTNPYGMGGTADTIWHCDTTEDAVYELDTTDFSVVKTASSPGSSPVGIGGDDTTLWHCDSTLDRVYELDADVPLPTDTGLFDCKLEIVWQETNQFDGLLQIPNEYTITIIDSEVQYIMAPSSEPQHSIVMITDEE